MPVDSIRCASSKRSVKANAAGWIRAEQLDLQSSVKSLPDDTHAPAQAPAAHFSFPSLRPPHDVAWKADKIAAAVQSLIPTSSINVMG